MIGLLRNVSLTNSSTAAQFFHVLRTSLLLADHDSPTEAFTSTQSTPRP